MNKQEFIVFAEAARRRMGEITAKKNADYTGKSQDPFANFRKGEFFGVGTAEMAVFHRMMDKFSRLGTYVSGQELQVTDEAIENECLDLANLSIILMALITERKPVETSVTIGTASSSDFDHWVATNPIGGGPK